MTANTLYKSVNNQYEVRFLQGADEPNYGVFNVYTARAEYKCDTLPQAIGVAEQFDYMLTNDVWKQELAIQFGVQEEELGQTLPLFSDTDGRSH